MSIRNFRYGRGLRNFELRLLVLYQPYFLTCAAVVVKRQKREVKMSNYRASFPRFLKRSNSRGRQPDGAPNPIDIHVGKRLRMRRRMLGLSLSELAKRLGISYQQIQHYENGTNRVTASRLWDLSQVLKTSVNFFFEEMDEETASSLPSGYIINSRNLADTE